MIYSGKAQARNQLILLILVFALIIALIILAKGLAGVLGEASDIELCKASTALASVEFKLKHIPVLKADSPVKSKCETEYLTINNKIPLNEEKVTIGEDWRRDEEFLKKFIFQKLATCWYQFGEGKVKVYQAHDDGPDSACSVCSKIVPGKDFPYNRGITGRITGLYSYAQENEHSENVNYLTYLTGGAEIVPDLNDVTSGGTITFNQPYFTVFQVVGHGIFNLQDKVDTWGDDDNQGFVGCTRGDGERFDSKEKAKNGKIGCNGDGTVDGVNFGRLIEGGIVTVRMVPASGITANNCKRLV